MAEVPDTSLLVAGLLVLALLAAGPSWASSHDLGDGTANVSVVSPHPLAEGPGDSPLQLRTTPGRFGSEATYLRLPDLVAEASDVEGRSRVLYHIEVPAMGVDRHESTLISDAGRVQVPMSDRAYPPADYEHEADSLPDPGGYEGRVTVRVQSFSIDRVVVNRSVEVVVQP